MSFNLKKGERYRLKHYENDRLSSDTLTGEATYSHSSNLVSPDMRSITVLYFTNPDLMIHERRLVEAMPLGPANVGVAAGRRRKTGKSGKKSKKARKTRRKH
jgi:hypothetical protein